MPRIDIKGPIVADSESWIYNFFGIPCVTPQSVTASLADADGQDIELLINSCGGDIFAATEIYDAIASYKGKLIIRVAFAASAASFIACAAESEIIPTGMLMLHNVSSYAEGNYQDMAHESTVLLNASKAVATAYRHKTGLSEGELLDIMDAETWLTAEEAVAKGFIDRVATYEQGQNNKPVALVAAINGLLPASVVEAKKQERAQLSAALDILKLKK